MTNLTKQEINLRIAKLVFPNAIITKCLQDESVIVGDALQYDRGRSFNFDCNNWNDLMPLVVEHGINFGKVHFGEDTPYFVARDINLMVANKDPQMALCLCLLKVLEDKEKEDVN